MDEVSEVKAVLGSSASQPSLDVVSSRPMTCDENGAWIEQVTSIKLGRGSVMLLSSRCPSILKAEAEQSAADEKWLCSLKPGTPEWS